MRVKTSINPDCITFSQMNMIFNARMYYRRLTVWTRAYLLSRYLGISNAEDIFGLLYYETLGLGNMLRIVHGREAAEKYSQILSRFVITLRDIITAQLEGNTDEAERNVNRMYQIAAERKEFIQKINPYASPAYEDLFQDYIRYVLEDANALAAGDAAADLTALQKMAEQADRLGDAFAIGIFDFITSGSSRTGDFQPGGGQTCITAEQMNVVFDVRMYWFEFAVWMRIYLLSRHFGIGDAEEIRSRLMQISTSYVNNLKKIFEDQVPEEYLRLLLEYIEQIDALVTAQMNGDAEEINRMTKLLYQNADERAAVIASINPLSQDVNVWKAILYENLQNTLEESITFHTLDYTKNIDVFGRLLDQAESTSNEFAQGLFQYILMKSPPPASGRT